MIGEEDMDTPLGDGYEIYTGGAEGTDTLAEQCARQWGMDVNILIPPGHDRTKTISPISTTMMESAVPFMRAAPKNLGKTCPSTNHPWPYSAKLLARNYCIVNRSRATYAFGRFVDPMNPCTLKGGTGWTVQMDIEIKKLLGFQVSQNLSIVDGKPVVHKWFTPLFVYDMYHKAWFELVPVVTPDQDTGTVISPFAFQRVYGAPLLDKSSAVVGSRHLDEATKQEIVALFNRSMASESNHRDQMQVATKKKNLCLHPNPQGAVAGSS